MTDQELTKKMARKEAIRRDALAKKGYFDGGYSPRTANIEQEVQILDTNIERAGMPIDETEFFKTNSIGARPDTSTFIVEYDGSKEPVYINSSGLEKLADTFLERTKYVQNKVSKGGVVISMGTNPILKSKEATTWLVKEGDKYQRYLHIDANAYSENPKKVTSIINPLTGIDICERASSIKGMFRVTGTQFHISEKNIADALDSHRTSIAIAPFMIAVFGNSPFLAGVDTGRSSSRIELLRQTEQLRSGLPKPAGSLLEYYEDILRLNSPFICTDNSIKALELAVSGIHTVSRIRVTMEESKGIVRNEFRHIDSQSPFKSMQAFMLTLGAIEAFRCSVERPLYDESQIDFQNSVWGYKTKMHWDGKLMSVKELGFYLVEKSLEALEKKDLKILAHKYLDPFKEELKQEMTQSDLIRESIGLLINQGATFNEALSDILISLNKKSLQPF